MDKLAEFLANQPTPEEVTELLKKGAPPAQVAWLLQDPLTLEEAGELVKNPLNLRILTLENRGWRSVPVTSVTEYAGARCEHAFAEFFPIDGLGFVPTLDFGEVVRQLQDDLRNEVTLGVDPLAALSGACRGNFICSLADDWQFATIARKARKRSGIQYPGRKHRSIAEVALKAIHELYAAFIEVHPNACCRMVADFVRSYDVRRFIADFCAGLAESETAVNLAGTEIDARDQAERARVEMFHKLDEFADAENHKSINVAAAGNRPGTRRRDPVASDRSQKANPVLLDGKTEVSFQTAQDYLGIGERHRQNLVKQKSLKVIGRGQNRKITVESLIDYLPLRKPEASRSVPK
ncbi:MAG: hypothetical protein WB676_21255 [Bryobacteraceae bacterium]